MQLNANKVLGVLGFFVLFCLGGGGLVLVVGFFFRVGVFLPFLVFLHKLPGN